MEDDAVIGREDAGHGADRRTLSIGAMHAGHRDRALPRLAVVDGNDTPSIDAPWHLMFILAGRDTSVALNATLGIAKKFHARHGATSLRCPDLAQGGFWLLHPGSRIEAVGRHRVYAFAQYNGVAPFGIFAAEIDTFEIAGERVRHPSHAFSDTLGDEGFYLRLRT